MIKCLREWLGSVDVYASGNVLTLGSMTFHRVCRSLQIRAILGLHNGLGCNQTMPPEFHATIQLLQITRAAMGRATVSLFPILSFIILLQLVESQTLHRSPILIQAHLFSLSPFLSYTHCLKSTNLKPAIAGTFLSLSQILTSWPP